MKKIIFVMIVALLLNLGLVNSITQEEINEAKILINSKADCKNLSNSQLEIIGEYYMEQMHPGEAHELMHKMMGLEEGSEAEEQFHINMARTMYCDEGSMMGGQNMQGGMMSSGGMANMMGNYYYKNPQSNNYQKGFIGFQIFFYILFILVVIVLILVIILLINKSRKQKGGKKHGRQ